MTVSRATVGVGGVAGRRGGAEGDTPTGRAPARVAARRGSQAAPTPPNMRRYSLGVRPTSRLNRRRKNDASS